MGTPYNTNLPADLRALQEEIEGYARDYGLDFYETIFEVLDAEDLNEVAAYGGFPTRYPHWSFGMSFEQLKKGYDYGLSKIYEMVINNDPCYAYLMRCNHTVDQKLVMAHVYGHCLAPETRIETRGGIKLIREVRAGDEVLTHTGAYRPVQVCARRWFEGKICRLRITGSNEVVRITGEHPVYVLRPSPCVLAGRQRVPCRPNCQLQHKCSAPRPYQHYQLTWIPAAEIRTGDVVVFPRRKAVPGAPPRFVAIPFDKILHRRRCVGQRRVPVGQALAKFLGYFIAEGSALPRGLVSFGFHSAESDYHRETARLAEELFGTRVGRDDYPGTHATTIRFNSLEVAAWLRKQVGTAAHDKRIPAFLFEHSCKDLLQACLQGLFNGDGYYTATLGRKSGTLSLTTTSETLAHQVRHAGLTWDLKASIFVRRPANRRTAYEVVWSGASAHRLSELLYGRDVIEGNRSFERTWTDDDYLYQQVRSVEEEDYAGWVHNFSVEADESYTLAAGMVVHNCDFFKNNAYFAHTSRKMMDDMANHGARLRRYSEKYGEDEVEAFIDRCMSIDDLIDVHSAAIRRREEVSRYDFSPEKEEDEGLKPTRFKSKAYMDDYINPRKVLKEEEEQRKKLREESSKSFPEHPQKDVLLFLIEHAPLKPWQRDVLEIIRDEAYYFAPQAQTKTLNEGWACLAGDSLILTSAGLLRARDIVAGQLPVQVTDGEAVRRVYDWANFPQRETVRIRTRRGLEMEGSVTHRVMLPDGTWRRLDELQIGHAVKLARGMNFWSDQLCSISWQPRQRLTLAEVAVRADVDVATVMRYRHGERGEHAERIAPYVAVYESERAQFGVSMATKRRQIRVPALVDERLATFLGYLIGDGHISEIKRVIGLTTGDESQADHFAALAEELFGLAPRKKWDATKWRVLLSSRQLQDFLIHLGLQTGMAARRKTVPDVILRSPASVVAAFLRALYDCDGYAGKAGVILATSSDVMSKVVQLLLLNFGILSTRTPHRDGCWRLQTLGQSAEVFERCIGFGLERKRAALQRYLSSHQWFKAQSDVDEIVSLERGRADVYDFSVEETHRYVAQGFTNHNSYWHSTIMTQKVVHPSEVIDYADHHSGTMATHGARINPYKLGIELLRDIEHRWNTGKFGKEYDECDDLDKRRKWDKQLGLGRQKIFEVRRVHNDITFIDTFLTPEFCVQHKMFSYAYQEQMGQYVIESRDFEKIKQRLLFSLTNFGKPWICVVDGNYHNRGELLLRHEHSGVDLRLDQAADTLANIQFIWSRPVHLQTVVDGKPTMLSFDGSEHTTRTLGESDDPRRNGPSKTR